MQHQHTDLEALAVLEKKGFTKDEVESLLSYMDRQRRAARREMSFRIYSIGAVLAFLILMLPGALRQFLLNLLQ